MKWNKYDHLSGLHSFLAPSKYHWINYDDEKLDETYLNYRAAQRGTELHEIASSLIKNNIKLPRTSSTLNMYVNDAIGFKMDPEVTLFYSMNCFGTADAISFRKNFLRIHDLKTGVTKASIKQLEVYAALFCLEYKESPNNIDCELRLYQSDEVVVHNPEREDVLYIMQKIRDFDERIKDLSEGERL